MQKRIRQIAAGKFESDQPSLSISDEELFLTVTEGQEYTGEFEITSENHIPVRGIVYSTHPRMECLTPQFEGENIRIRYQFHSKGLVEGQEEKGAFVILCNQSVHSLSFCVSISRLYAQTATGAIRSLSDFTALAKENWQEAYQLFYHKSFPNILKAKETKEKMYYQGILAAKPSSQNLEEFLVAAGRKEQIHFTISETDCRFDALTESQQQKIEIKKSEWGYLELAITSDAAFVQPAQTQINSEDFLGSTFVLKYIVDYDRMHAGNNYAKITFSSVYETKVLEIYAHKGEKQKSKEQKEHAKIRECQSGLVELYEAFRLKKIVTGVWANESVERLNQLHAMLPDQVMYPLMKAQALVINHQKQEAEWILEEFKREWPDHHTPEWGYYLYIMTLLEREPAYVDRMTHEIEMIFHENPDSALLFWILSFLEEEYYNNSAHKLRAIAHWVMSGCVSPYLYLEAYDLISHDPYLLTKLGRFEVRILRWAIRHQVLTKELAAQIFEVVEMNQGFHPVHFELMQAAYGTEEKPEYVGQICSYLIRTQQFDTKFHHWYEKGIGLELRITGLYEAYLMSLDEREIASVPKIIRMYFQYDSNLPYRKMAILYNNIIASKESEPEIYEQYRRVMSRFAMEQIEQEHVDDNLAVVYEDMLELGLVNEELAKCLSNILFAHKLVIMQPHMVRAIVYQKQMKDPQIVPIVNGCAYVSLFCREYAILFEDGKGQRYIHSVPYRLDSLMDAGSYLEKCTALAPEELPYIVSHFGEKPDHHMFDAKEEKFFRRVLFAQDLDTEYQSYFSREIVRYYQKKEQKPLVEQYLEQADYEQMPQAVRQYMMESLADWRMYDRLHEQMQEYGLDQIGSSAKVAVATYLLDAMEEREQDEELLLLCTSAFLNKKYNDRILQYLSDFYSGPVETMLRLWRAAQNFELRTRDLEERILEQMLYTDMDLMQALEVFAHYYESGGQELIVLAVITVFAQNYFVKEAALPKQILAIIRRRYQSGKKLNDACKLALLKSFSGMSSLQEAQYEAADVLLAEFTGRNMNFSFYKRLDRRLVQKYHLYDKIYVEHRTNPKKHVVLHYSRDEDGEQFHEVDMPNVYAGIFVETFVVFFGEEIQYYITEEYKNKVVSTESNRLTCNDIYAQKDESRYNLINQMLISETLSDEVSMFQTMKQYAGYDEVTKKVFKLL